MPPPKNVAARPRVLSMNWSGRTMSRGRISSFIEPTAEAERIRVTPRDFSA